MNTKHIMAHVSNESCPIIKRNNAYIKITSRTNPASLFIVRGNTVHGELIVKLTAGC
jgi:hypothetical protein